MTTITFDFHADEVLPELSDKELVEEVKLRGYQCEKDSLTNELTSEELDVLLQMLRDSLDYESRRIYDKLLDARYG